MTRRARSPSTSSLPRSCRDRPACAPAARSARSSAVIKLAERETGREHHVSADIGCHLFAINAPFNMGATTMGYGLGSAGGAALNSQGRGPTHDRGHGRRRLLAQRADERRRQRRVQPSTISCWSSSTTTTPPPPAGRTSSPPTPTIRRARPNIRSKRPSAGSASSGRRRSTTPSMFAVSATRSSRR